MNDPKRILVVLLGLIVLVLIVLGIKGHFESEGYKTQVTYTTAIQSTDAKTFNYTVDTQQGNLLTNGVFKTDDKNLTKFPEMTKGFTYVRRTKEHYTMHTYTTCSKNSCTTHVYYSWDEVDEEEQYANKISFDGREYNPNIFNLHNFLKDQSCDGITANDKSSGWFSSKHGCDGDDYYLDNDDRYVYDVVPQTFTATFLASSMGGGLHGVGESKITLQNRSIAEQMHYIGAYKVILFWVFLVIIFIVTCFAIWGAWAWVMEDGVWSLRD